MSLILEALKKVERERQGALPRGVVVVSAGEWAGSRAPFAWMAIAAASALAGGAVVYGTLRAARTAESEPARVAAGVPAALPDGGAAAIAPEPLPLPVSRARQPLAREAVPAATPSTTAPRVREGAAPNVRPQEDVRLSAISMREDGPVAILNDRLVREGDTFDGIRVLRIDAAEVEIEVQGERRTLRF